MDIFAVLKEASGEITVKKSRFIGTAFEVHSEDEASAIIESMRKKYWDAKHNCYAYVTGRNNEIQRFSDDKEPSGTAGKPILEVLLSSNVRNCLIVVTRYFGGVLLGTGGLVRAYTDASVCAVEALKSAGRLLPILSGRSISFECDYKDISRFDSLCMRLDMCTVSKDYQENVIYNMIIDDSHIASFLKEASNITRGAFKLLSEDPVIYLKSGINAVLYDL